MDKISAQNNKKLKIQNRKYLLDCAQQLADEYDAEISNETRVIVLKDLSTNVFPLSVLGYNYENLCPIEILRTQHLSANFCAKYIMNDTYLKHELHEITYKICEDYVLQLQPHICPIELRIAVELYNNYTI